MAKPTLAFRWFPVAVIGLLVLYILALAFLPSDDAKPWPLPYGTGPWKADPYLIEQGGRV